MKTDFEWIEPDDTEDDTEQKPLQAGDAMIANAFCGFPDGTVQGESYIVSRVERWGFYIMDSDGNEIFPVSTTFKKEDK